MSFWGNGGKNYYRPKQKKGEKGKEKKEKGKEGKREGKRGKRKEIGKKEGKRWFLAHTGK